MRSGRWSPPGWSGSSGGPAGPPCTPLTYPQPRTESPGTPVRVSPEPERTVNEPKHTQPNPEISHNVYVEFTKKISGGGVRSATGLLAALSRASGNPILVTDEIAREAATRGGYSGPWPPEARARPGAAEIARQAVRKRRDILARHARPGETWEDVEQRLARDSRI